MSLSKSKCWYSNNCLHFLKCAIPFSAMGKNSMQRWDGLAYKNRIGKFTAKGFSYGDSTGQC